MIIYLDDEGLIKFIIIMAKSLGEVDFKKYIIGYYDKGTLVRWGFSINYLRDNLCVVYFGKVDEEKIIWEILNIEMSNIKHVYIKGKVPTLEEELIY